MRSKKLTKRCLGMYVLYVYNKHNTTYKALCAVFTHSLSMPLHQKSHSFAALTCSISDSTTRCLAKYRPRTLSMKYSTCIIEKRSVTSRYHCSKISRSLLDRDGHLHCRMMEENYGLTFCSSVQSWAGKS